MQQADNDCTQHPAFEVQGVFTHEGRPHFLCSAKEGCKLPNEEAAGIFTPTDDEEPVWIVCGPQMDEARIHKTAQRFNLEAEMVRECRDASRAVRHAA